MYAHTDTLSLLSLLCVLSLCSISFSVICVLQLQCSANKIASITVYIFDQALLFHAL